LATPKTKLIDYGHNQVFLSSDLVLLGNRLQVLKDAGKAAVVRQTFRVQPNSWWGIKGNYDVDLTLVYNAQCKEFESLLPKETSNELRREYGGKFENFPHYKTTSQNDALSSGLVGLTASQVNLLAAQGEYTIRQNEAIFKEVLS